MAGSGGVPSSVPPIEGPDVDCRSVGCAPAASSPSSSPPPPPPPLPLLLPAGGECREPSGASRHPGSRSAPSARKPTPPEPPRPPATARAPRAAKIGIEVREQLDVSLNKSLKAAVELAEQLQPPTSPKGQLSTTGEEEEDQRQCWRSDGSHQKQQQIHQHIAKGNRWPHCRQVVLGLPAEMGPASLSSSSSSASSSPSSSSSSSSSSLSSPSPTASLSAAATASASPSPARPRPAGKGCGSGQTGSNRELAAGQSNRDTRTATSAFPDLTDSSRSGPELKSVNVESWLDDHPLFVHDYFLRKANRQLIDDWLITNAKVSEPRTAMTSQLDPPESPPTTTTTTTTTTTGTSNKSTVNESKFAVQRHQRSSLQHYPTTAPSAFQNSLASTSAASIAASSSVTLGQEKSNYKFSSRFSDDLNYYYRVFSNSLNNHHQLQAPCGSGTTKKRSISSTGAASRPFRKISATDFESKTGSIFLRPMLSTTPDGKLTFLSQPIEPATSSMKPEQNNSAAAIATIRHAATEKDLFEEKANRKARDQEVASNPLPAQPEANEKQGDEVRLIFELVKDICSDLDIRTLLHKILKNIAVLINADKSSLFLVCGSANDPNRHLVSQLFNVDQDSEVGDELDTSCSSGVTNNNNNNNNNKRGYGDNNSVRIPWGFGLVGYVAATGETLNIPNCYKDPRFTDTIDQRTGYRTEHMICAPIFDGKRNELVGVAQVINKRDGNPFSEADKIKFERYLQFCGIGLSNAQSYEHCQLENKRNQVLLDLARMVFEEQSTIEEVVYRIMLHTQSLLECLRCQVLLIDDGSDNLDQLLQLTSGCYIGNSNYPIRAKADASNQQQDAHYNPPVKPEWRPQCGRANSPPSCAGYQPETDDWQPEVAARNTNEQANETKEGSHRKWGLHPPDESLFSLVFDLECDGNEFVMHTNASKPSQQQQQQQRGPTAGRGSSTTTNDKIGFNQRKFPINIGITGHVAMTGETLNIREAHKCPRFDPKVDENCPNGFRHQSILCMPIRNGQRQIIGVSQLINKKNGRPFNKNDEDLFEAFAIFCGLGIHNTLMYEKVLKIMAKQRVTFEVLSYHATAPLDEAKKLHREQVPSSFALDLHSLKFNDFSLNDQFMLKSCLRFFRDLDLIRRFQIDELVFCNWILSVQKNYRKVTYHPIVGGTGLKASPVRYHNWRHAFNVTQMMFAIMINTQICQPLGELETLALLIACLCHDLDHRGTNNSFQIKSASPLAQLYSTSTMEHHHFDQCVMILNSQGNQILAKLSPGEYSRVIVLLEEAILATDLANYFQKREHFFQLINSNTFDWKTNLNHRSLLRCMLMTACDVAAITKPWPVQKVVADLVMSEFYQQGDIERNELNIEPIDDLMNREKKSKLPEMQISFIESICAPIYSAFARQFPRELSPLLEGCLANRDIWREVAKRNKEDEEEEEEEQKRNSAKENDNHNSGLASYLNNNPNIATKRDTRDNETKLPKDHDSLYRSLEIDEYEADHMIRAKEKLEPETYQSKPTTKNLSGGSLTKQPPGFSPRSCSICREHVSWFACCKRKSI